MLKHCVHLSVYHLKEEGDRKAERVKKRIESWEFIYLSPSLTHTYPSG